MHNFFTISGKFITLLSIVFVIFKINQNLGKALYFDWSFSSAATLVLLVMTSLSNIGITAYAWKILLRGGGISIDFRTSYIILGKAQIAKYFPGNIFQYCGRIALGTKAGIPLDSILTTMGAEMTLIMGTSALIAISGLSFGYIKWVFPFETLHSYPIIIIFILFILLLISIPALGRFTEVRQWIRERLVYFHPRSAWASVVSCLSFFVLIGLLISLSLITLWGFDNGMRWHQFSCGFALAWILGFIVPGAPGGIGIREAIFVGLFGPELGDGTAIGLAILLRIVTSVGDLLAFGAACWLARTKGVAENLHDKE